MHRTINQALGKVVDYPWTIAFLIVGLTGVSVLGYVDPDFPRRAFALFRQPGSSGAAAVEATTNSAVVLPEVAPDRIYDADVVIMVQSEQIFTAAGVDALRAMVADLERLGWVEQVRWMDRVPILNVFGLPEPIFPRGTPTPNQLANSRRRALEHPLVVGQMLSQDATTTLLMVTIDWTEVRSNDEVTTRLTDLLRDRVARSEGFAAEIRATGPVPLYLASVRSREANQFRYQAIAYSVIAIVALILFRGPIAVFVVSLAPALGVFWTLGILRYFDLQDNPFNDVILPTLLSLVGLTDGVHVMVQIRHHRSSGLSPRDAASLGTSEVGLACLLTTLTTAIGLGSLTLADHKIVQEFGWCSMIGVTLTVVAVLTVIPLAARTFLGARIHSGHSNGLIQRRLVRIGLVVDAVVRRRGVVSVIAIGATILLAIGALRLEPDERRQNGLPQNSEAVQAMVLLDEKMGGLETANVSVRWDDRVSSQSPDILAVLDEVHRVLGDHSLIGHPLSVARLIEGLPGSGSGIEGGEGGNRMAMVELLPPPLKRAFFVPETRNATVTFRVQDLGIAKYADVFQRVEKDLASVATAHPGFVLELGGRAVYRWRNLYRIVVDLAKSLGMASVVIFVVLGIVYRSVRIGLVSVVPNMFPLAFTATGLVLFGQGMELVSVCAFTVCLGIAVDDTIHFVTRYLECCEDGDRTEDAIHRSFVSVGTALITTTIILVAGFSTVLSSDSRDPLIFAAMGISTFLSALFADLVFLPALLARFCPAERYRGRISR